MRVARCDSGVMVFVTMKSQRRDVIPLAFLLVCSHESFRKSPPARGLGLSFCSRARAPCPHKQVLFDVSVVAEHVTRHELVVGGSVRFVFKSAWQHGAF